MLSEKMSCPLHAAHYMQFNFNLATPVQKLCRSEMSSFPKHQTELLFMLLYSYMDVCLSRHIAK